MKDTHFTVVFQVSDWEKFRDYARKFSSAMFDEHDIPGCSRVTGCGVGDSMSESDYMAEFLDEKGYDSQQIMKGNYDE